MRTAAILPVKTFARAKQRLGAAVDAPDRSVLAAAMVGDVLAALAAVPGLDDVVVVTAEERAAAAAREAGVHVVPDPVEAGQSAAAELGIETAAARGATRVLLVPGDCPALDAREVSALLERDPGRPSVVIVPDRHGSGTNALLIDPPDALAPAFGVGSFARHAARPPPPLGGGVFRPPRRPRAGRRRARVRRTGRVARARRRHAGRSRR